MLILPANVPKFVEKAYRRGADAIALDLEDSVPPSEKDKARAMVKDAVTTAGRGGADILVRVNNEPELLDADLDACICPALHAVFVPKIETPEQVTDIEEKVTRLERDRGLEPGTVKLSLHMETPKGILNIKQIALALSRYRVESMSFGPDDYCLQLGVPASVDGQEIFLAFSMMVIAAKAAGINALGIYGTVADFTDLTGFQQAAIRARRMGTTGAYCIHPNQVAVLNRVFSPEAEDVELARRQVEAFEEGLKKGRASVNLDGRMVDTPVYCLAKRRLDLAEAIAEKERRKAEALARSGE
jgi:citrate lyase subunit beta/citryl-CoA lyase